MLGMGVRRTAFLQKSMKEQSPLLVLDRYGIWGSRRYSFCIHRCPPQLLVSSVNAGR